MIFMGSEREQVVEEESSEFGYNRCVLCFVNRVTVLCEIFAHLGWDERTVLGKLPGLEVFPYASIEIDVINSRRGRKIVRLRDRLSRFVYKITYDTGRVRKEHDKKAFEWAEGETARAEEAIADQVARVADQVAMIAAQVAMMEDWDPGAEDQGPEAEA